MCVSCNCTSWGLLLEASSTAFPLSFLLEEDRLVQRQANKVCQLQIMPEEVHTKMNLEVVVKPQARPIRP